VGRGLVVGVGQRHEDQQEREHRFGTEITVVGPVPHAAKCTAVKGVSGRDAPLVMRTGGGSESWPSADSGAAGKARPSRTCSSGTLTKAASASKICIAEAGLDGDHIVAVRIGREDDPEVGFSGLSPRSLLSVSRSA